VIAVSPESNPPRDACAFMASGLHAAPAGSRMGAGPLMGGLNFDRYDLDSVTAVC
jgi:hypothetical protein